MIKIQVYDMFIEMKYIILVDNNKRETIVDIRFSIYWRF